MFLAVAAEEHGGNPFDYIFHHALDDAFGMGSTPVSPSKFTLTMLVGAGLLLLAARSMNTESAVPKGRLRGIFESLYFFIRDELVYPTMGEHHGRVFVPFFMTVFSFILTLNLLGMVPIPGIGGAVTATLGFTLPMALVILAVSIGAGIKYNGPAGFLKGFIPPGLPVWLVPAIFALEIIGFFIKHGVLAVRLFANMLAGHMVIGAFLGLIFLFNAYWMAVPSVLLALAISFLELLVAFLQAYVFTLLSVLFIGATVHPEH
ncbi:MAG: F0F1 ATP synthase subunit A [Planctomycetota bacterium]